MYNHQDRDPGLRGVQSPRGAELPGTERGQLERASDRILSKFVPVSCDSLMIPFDTKPCMSKDTLKLSLQVGIYTFPPVLGSCFKSISQGLWSAAMESKQDAYWPGSQGLAEAFPASETGLL